MAIAFTLNKQTRFIAVAVLAALSTASFASQEMAKPSLYERLGGIHKIAQITETLHMSCLKDKVMMSNENFAMASKGFPAPAVNFLLAGYFAHLTGGPQTSMADIAKIEKWFNYTPEQQMHEMKHLSEGMHKMGYSDELIQELETTYGAEYAKAEPMQPSPEMIEDKTSLYGRLGGLEPIAIVTDDFVNRLATDPTLLANPNTVKSLQSGKVTAAGLKYLVTEQLCAASGGPFKYSGRTMADSHKGLNISEKEWAAGAKLLIQSLNKYSVPSKEQSEILALISSTKGDIVGH